MANRGWFRLLQVLWLQIRAAALTLLSVGVVISLTPSDTGNIIALLWGAVLVMVLAFAGGLALRIVSVSTLARLIRPSVFPRQK